MEVTGLESVQAVARDWMVRSWGEDEAARRLSAVAETHWKARQFIVEPAPGHPIAFWEWDDPHKGRPVAVEGDLSAHGMRFAVVVARWNAVITDRLLQGALDGLYRSGAARRDVQVTLNGADDPRQQARVLIRVRYSRVGQRLQVVGLGRSPARLQRAAKLGAKTVG